MNELIERLRAVVRGQNVLTSAHDVEPYVKDWRGIYEGTTPAVVRPATAEQVAAVVKLCSETGTGIVPQGGNTGMCMASVPRAGRGEIVLSLARMNRIREVDPLNNTMTVEAGVVLETIQSAAAEIERLFPLSLGGQGSCMIGGNISTNAGGVNVLRYGNTRDLVLGLEVVLPDGRIWDGLRGLRKDNTGYDLKQLFVGAEGTLGIITAAVLKLFPKPSASATAWLAVKNPETALELLALLRGHCGERINAFELISRNCLDLVLRHIPGTRDPLPGAHAWYVLTEIADSRSGDAVRQELERALEGAMEGGLVLDATIAESGAQAEALWRIRESIPEAARGEAGMLYRHDISVAVSAIPGFIREAGPILEQRFPGAELICFGHLGDGNLHYNAFIPGRARSDPAAREAHDVTDLIYDIVQRYGGSFSAEHGIGLAKVAELQRYKSDTELDLMRTIKRALDPRGLMNPGKVL
ncbi:MAG TPA: FAD-binding oxidoreductase [Burkholderiales bacterium]|nr:FAD-binding oxidoreductase [Burkholderiales bacterium]